MKSSFTQDQINFIKSKIPELPELEKKVIRTIFWNEGTEWDLAKRLRTSPYIVFEFKKGALKSLEKIYKKEFYGQEPVNWWKVVQQGERV